MARDEWSALIEQLRHVTYQSGIVTADSPAHRITFLEGLSDTEVEDIEWRLGLRFPSDLRSFLQTALPTGHRFPSWRHDADVVLQDWMDVPRQRIIEEIEKYGYWNDRWGPRPEQVQSAVELANQHFAEAPKLIPLFAHRMMPDDPTDAGNPVFSLWGTDIIYYGFDLEDYFRNEFHLGGVKPRTTTPKAIRFWDDLVS